MPSRHELLHTLLLVIILRAMERLADVQYAYYAYAISHVEWLA